MIAADEVAGLTAGARALSVSLSADQCGRLLEFTDLLYTWNRRIGLTSIERADALRLHLLDSLALVPLVRAAGTLVDLGSGAGLPGIPVAIAAPGVDVVLVESKRRRCSFLVEAVRRLALENCRVLQEDARVLAASGRPYDAVVGRAFLPPRSFVEMAAALVAPGGLLVVMGGREPLEASELAAAAGPPFDIEAALRVDLPGGAEVRRLLALRRSS